MDFITESTVILNQQFILHPLKAAFWVNESALLIADAHFGKSKHFRKNGLAVPSVIDQGDFNKLMMLISFFQPQKVIFLGDLFHSQYNSDWNRLKEIIKSNAGIVFHLILGNHDIIHHQTYLQAGLKTNSVYSNHGIMLTHHPMIPEKTDQYNLAGHIHPGIVLTGAGRQRLRAPCFYFGKNNGLLPAFGNFTGIHPIDAYEGDQVYVVMEKQIIPKH
jgi:uncharacterized protein